MDAIFELVPLWALVGAFAVTFFAGVVKGAVGFAMPLVMVSGLGLFLEPAVAVAALILPIVMSNALQVARFGWAEARSATIEYRRYILIVCVMIAISAQFLTRIPGSTMYLVLGVPVLVLSLIQLLGVRFRIRPERRVAAEWGIGAAAGALGGLSGTWGPPTVLFLIALETPKTRQIVVQGVVYGLGAVTLLLAHVTSGVLNAATAPLSAILLIPAFAGMWAGFAISDRIDQEMFRKATLVVLVVAGANLIRRGLMG